MLEPVEEPSEQSVVDSTTKRASRASSRHSKPEVGSRPVSTSGAVSESRPVSGTGPAGSRPVSGLAGSRPTSEAAPASSRPVSAHSARSSVSSVSLQEQGNFVNIT